MDNNPNNLIIAPYQEASDQTNERPQIVHLRTTVQTVLGVLDGNDVTQEIPVQVQVQRLDPKLFDQAARTLLEHKAKLQSDLDKKGGK